MTGLRELVAGGLLVIALTAVACDADDEVGAWDGATSLGRSPDATSVPDGADAGADLAGEAGADRPPDATVPDTGGVDGAEPGTITVSPGTGEISNN